MDEMPNDFYMVAFSYANTSSTRVYAHTYIHYEHAYEDYLKQHAHATLYHCELSFDGTIHQTIMMTY